ncbi:hypothetical protein Gogos_004902 [Gossypium gossypioides]|uniref:Reverse transcriptase zinc-binding domain-containing protein n=1 Tax=Gossypium gossypioides TaxID=34282 RepID=A0A7J9CHY9_GOSGO|nr:hypothetical protein [Gossypium gossypioides]
MGDQICNLSLNGKESNDRVVWFHNPSGFYTSRTAYSWLLLRQMGFGPHRAYWRIIWKLNTLLKIRVFTWRVGHEILPTNDKITSIRHGFLKDCPRYSANAETLIHALKDCPNARTILTIGGLDNRLLMKDYACCINWIEDVMRVLDKKAVVDFFTTLWNSWNNGNNHIFRGKEDEATVVWERAKTLSNEFRIHNLVNDPLIPVTPVCKKWEKPPCGFVKVNFNDTVTPNRIGYGMIARDEHGFLTGGGGGFKEEALTVEWAELYALEESLKLASSMNI